MKNFRKVCCNSLSCLDNTLLYVAILIVLVLYASTIFENVNSYVGSLYNFSVVKLLVLLLITYIAQKDTCLAVLLGVCYTVSLMYTGNMENFRSTVMAPQEKKTAVENNKRCSEGQAMNSSGECVPVQKRCPSGTVMNSSGQCVEGFFPMMNNHESNESNESNESHEPMHSTAMLNNSDVKPNESSCLQMYEPHFETISDVCNSTATFKNQLNAQGLDNIQGYTHNSGSPLV